MKLKKILVLLLALAVLLAALPFSAHAEKKKKDGPDEPKLAIVITDEGSDRVTGSPVSVACVPERFTA